MGRAGRACPLFGAHDRRARALCRSTHAPRARRGILMGAGGSRRPCGCPAPIRRARRDRKRACAGWAPARSPPAHREERAWGAASASHRAPRARRGILMGAGDSRTPRAPPTPARRAQRARAEALKASKGLWCGARYGHGGVRHPRRWSPCVPRRCETLYVTPRPTQSRPTHSARAWWPCTCRL